MEALFFLAIIVYAIVNATSKKKQAQRKEILRRVTQQYKKLVTEQAPIPEHKTAPARPAAAKPAPNVVKHTEWKTPFGDKPQARTASAVGARKEGKYVSPEGQTGLPMQKRPDVVTSTVRTKDTRMTEVSETQRHRLESSTLTGHAHTESSITGIEKDCDTKNVRRPLAAKVQPDKPTVAAPRVVPSLDAATMRQAFIYSEILAKPKSLRSGQCR